MYRNEPFCFRKIYGRAVTRTNEVSLMPFRNRANKLCAVFVSRTSKAFSLVGSFGYNADIILASHPTNTLLLVVLTLETPACLLVFLNHFKETSLTRIMCRSFVQSRQCMLLYVCSLSLQDKFGTFTMYTLPELKPFSIHSYFTLKIHLKLSNLH